MDIQFPNIENLEGATISPTVEYHPLVHHFPADVYFENGRMTFVFDNAMLSMEVDNTKLEELKALIKCQRKRL